jgi:hypothetical protein
VQIGVSTPTKSEAAGLGNLAAILHRDRRWILRRVEKLQLLDDHTLERRITFDIDLDALRGHVRAADLEPQTYIPVPLLRLAKAPLKDIDIVDGSGAVCPLLTRQQDSHLVAAMIMHEATGLEISGETAEQLFNMVRHHSGELFDEIPDIAFGETTTSELIPSMSAHTRATWQRLLENSKMLAQMFFYSRNFLFLPQVSLSSEKSVEVVKVRLLEDVSADVHQPAKSFSLEAFGLAPSRHTVTVGGLGFAQSDHVRMNAPSDSFIRSAELRKAVTDPLLEQEQDQVTDGRLHNGRLAPLDRVAFYRTAAPIGQRLLTIWLEPSRGVFLLPGFLTTALLAFFLLCATFLQATDKRFSDSPLQFGYDSAKRLWEQTSQVSPSSDSAVTLLVLVPSLVAIYLTRRDEHKIVTRLMAVPRFMVMISAAGAIASAAATSAAVAPGLLFVIYLVSSLVATLAAGMLLVPLIRVSWFLSRRGHASSPEVARHTS